MSLSTTATGPPAAARNAAGVPGSNTSPCSRVAPANGVTSARSRPITRQPRAAATCDQLPGALPRSTTVRPGLSSPNRRSISRSL